MKDEHKKPLKQFMSGPLLKGVIEFLECSAWAITPDWLDKINSIVGRKVHGVELNAEIMSDMEYSHATQIVGGKALIPVIGPIFKKANLMTQFSGATSLELAGRDFKRALDNDAVEEIILKIDSPGGTVDGTKEFVNLVLASRGRKPITAYIDGQGTSAAYWIAVAADKIIASSETAMVGSVGVISAHYDYSKYDEEVGVKRTYIYKGKFKGIANDASPLSKDGKEHIQERIDGLYGIFVEGVAEGLGITVKEALSRTGESKVFNGKEALDRGLINEIKSLDDIMGKKEAQIKNKKEVKKEVHKMTLEELKAEQPGLVQLIEVEARNGYVAEGELKSLKEETAKLTEQVGELKIVCDAQGDKIKEQAKVIVCHEEATNRAIAIGIQKEALSSSDIPDSLHGKVSGMVDYRAFLSDDNILDKEGFKTAFDAEVKDWEGKLNGDSGARGDGDEKVDKSFTDKADYADENAAILATI